MWARLTYTVRVEVVTRYWYVTGNIRVSAAAAGISTSFEPCNPICTVYIRVIC
jgi:hypothetical protein